MQVELVDDRICPGCKQSAISDSGGLVVAFGSSFFHVDCFKCAKCGDKVTADTNLLLLSDGSPICANCSYCCNVCQQPILDEAIMTGDDSYHAHCFKCKVCKSKIDELVFAKTSQGIYCMNCHNERMIKIRKHAQKKAERERLEREKAAARGETVGLTFLVPPPSYTNHNGTPAPHVTVSRPAKQPLETPSAAGTPSSLQTSFETPGNNRSKRRSINPGLVLANTSNSAPISSPPGATLSPMSASFGARAQGQPPTTPPPIDSGPPSPSATSSGHHSHEDHSRSRTLSSPAPPAIETIIRPPLRTSSTSESVQKSSSRGGKLSPIDSPSRRDSEAGLVPIRSRSVSRSRSASPSHAADVPQGIESGTDTDNDDHVHRKSESVDDPPPPPPKEVRANGNTSQDGYYQDPDSFVVEEESQPVEQVSHSTFIAPALPPIRFSLSNGDFSEMFRGNGIPPPGANGLSMKDLAQLARIAEGDSSGPLSPPVPPDAYALAAPSPYETTSFSTGSSATLGASGNDDESADDHGQRGNATESESGHDNHSKTTPLGKLTRKLSKGRKKLKEGAGGREASRSPDVPNAPSSSMTTKITISAPLEAPSSAAADKTTRPDPADLVIYRLKQALADAKERGAQQLRLDPLFVEAIVESLESKKTDYADLKSKFDGIRRTSKQYIDGLTVAQTEYDRELKARRDAEAEVTRLRVLLSGQAVRLTTLAGDSKRAEMRQQMSKELKDNLSGLEQEMSKLKAERDMTLAEVEELSANRSDPSLPDSDKRLGRSLTMRLDSLKVQYERDLIPLISQKDALSREIQELKGVRETFLEETTVLNARNEELAQLSAQYARRMEMAEPASRGMTGLLQSSVTDEDTMKPNRLVHHKIEVDATPTKGKFMNWPSRSTSKQKDLPVISTPPPSSVELAARSSTPKMNGSSTEHNFQQLSVLRFARCDHCGDKMWGSQLRCTACNISIHVRCVNHVASGCNAQNGAAKDEPPAGPLPPSMFGRELSEQVRADAKGGDRRTPVIVDKCIEAVEALAMDYEGIYRKTGGSSQTKAITQLFERGDYVSFDLRDSDRFNDICSVTSVLKTYFRNLPTPLLTYDLHDSFMAAVEIRDPATKNKTLLDIVNQLPDFHYYTLRTLMLHLHRVKDQSEQNLMTSRNLGVVFGRIQQAEFSDMAGKALSVEWLVENATLIFTP
ncbi:hypothetical protein DL96DRAFT_1602759 [Flagelloscypha sp. PMI_526]|nr:hypothetical protein DL96DRAFT_1602759 [Flagelloscypha sp. PMI_526]